MQLIKSGATVALLTLVSRIFGYLRDIMMTSYLGLNADAFTVAFRLPNTFRSLFAEGAFSSAFVPMFAAKLAKDGKEDALTFAKQVFTILTLILSFFITLMLIFMPQVIALLAPGFADNPEKLALTTTLAYFTTPYLFFIALASLYASVLNSAEKFLIASILPIILNLVMIIAIKFFTPFSQSPSHALSYGVLLAGIIQFIVITFAAKYAALQINFTKIEISADIKKMFNNMLPAIVGSGVVQINLAVDTIIASFYDGAATILYLADRLNQFPLAIIGTALSTVLLPTLSKQIRIKAYNEAQKTQTKALEVALFFTFPCAFAFYFISPELIELLFERGNFTNEASIKVAKSLTALAFGLPAFVLIKIFTPRYFAEHDTKTPVKISAICIFLNIFFCLIFTRFYSYLGISMATSLSAWINVALLYYFQHRRHIFKIEKGTIFQTFKIIFACFLMSFSLILYKYLTKNIVISCYLEKFFLFFGEIFFAMALYFLVSFALKIINIKSIFESRKSNG